MFSLNSVTYNLAASVISIFQTFFGYILAGIMKIFDLTLMMSVGFYNAPVVDAAWGILRDFSNMFFIVALIIMAFATIFEVSGYNFKSMIVRFLIAAVMINFSLALSKTFLQFSDILSHVFLNALGDISSQLGQGLRVVNTTPNPGSISVFGSFFGGILQTSITGIWGLILIGIVIMSMGTATAFIFVRIPIIWFLLVFAPIPILLSIFPGTKKNFDWWLNMMLGWGLYLPVFLFFLYFGMYFLSKQDEILTAVNLGNTAIPGDVTFQMIFSYFLACFFILGGVKTANSISFIASSNVIKWTQGTTGWVAKRTGLSGAWQQRKAQFQEEGARGKFLGVNLDRFGASTLYGGKQAQQQREAAAGRIFGNRDAQIKQQKLFLDQVKKEWETIEQQVDTGQISDQVIKDRSQGDANNAKVFAYRKMLAKRGLMSPDIYTSTIRELKNNQLAAQDFAKTSKESKFSNLKDNEILDIASAMGPSGIYNDLRTAIPVRREMYDYIKSENRLISQLKYEQFEEGINISGGSTSKGGKDLITAVGKIRPDLLVKYNMDVTNFDPAAQERVNKTREANKDASGNPLPDNVIIERIYRGAIKGDPKETAALPKDVWATPEFQSAMKDYLSKIPQTKGQRDRYVINLLKQFNDDLKSGPDKVKELKNIATGIPGISPIP